jgi:tetratricopeptide (TPR) repeat protein
MRCRIRDALPLVLCALVACTDSTSRAPPDLEPAAEVLFDGCTIVARGPRCLLTRSATVVLWTTADVSQSELTVDEAPVQVAWVSVDRGHRAKVRLQKGARQLAVVERGRRAWVLPVGDRAPPAWLDGVQTSIAKGDLSEADRQLAEVVSASTAAERAEVLRQRGRIAWRRGEPQAAQLRARAADLSREAGLISWAVDDLVASAHALHSAGDLDAAARAAERAREWTNPEYARGVAHADELETQLQLSMGDRRAAWAAVQRLQRLAERLDVPRLRWSSSLMAAKHLRAVGRPRRALELLDDLAALPLVGTSPCHEAVWRNHRAWSALMMLEAAEPVDEASLKEDLRRAREIHSSTCRGLDTYAHDLMNQALFSILKGDLRSARADLDQIGPDLRRSVRVGLWFEELRGRVLLAAGQLPAAARRFERLQRRASALSSIDGAWRAHVGLARTRHAQGAHVEARRAFEQALAVEEKLSRMVSVTRDRSAFLASHASVVQDYVDLLLDMRAPRAAFDLVRRARIRFLSQLDRDTRIAGLSPEQRGEWRRAMAEVVRLRGRLEQRVQRAWSVPTMQLPAHREEVARLERQLDAAFDGASSILGWSPTTALPPLPPDVTTVTFFRARSGWLGFGVRGGRRPTCTHRGPRRPQPRRRARRLLDARSAARARWPDPGARGGWLRERGLRRGALARWGARQPARDRVRAGSAP